MRGTWPRRAVLREPRLEEPLAFRPRRGFESRRGHLSIPVRRDKVDYESEIWLLHDAVQAWNDRQLWINQEYHEALEGCENWDSRIGSVLVDRPHRWGRCFAAAGTFAPTSKGQLVAISPRK
jgi:hypothetical protein